MGRPAYAALFGIVACGGQTTAASGIDASTDQAAGWADAGTMPAFDGADPCSPGGVRLCGGDCGTAGSCPVCSPIRSGAGATSAFGVCWADLSDLGNTPCALCADGQGCVQRKVGEFVCVPLDVCGALRALGAADVCWYGDKVPFDGSAVPTASGCPGGGSTPDVCGGDCPPCALGTLARCVGRGPDHPFGSCPSTGYTESRTDVDSYPTCSVATSGASPCPALPESAELTYACAVSPFPPGDPAVAPQTGYCLGASQCSALATTLPGGLWCFDAQGNRIAP